MYSSSRPSRKSKPRWPEPSPAEAPARRRNPPGSVANSTRLHLVERRLKGNEMRFHDPSATSMSASIVGTDADIAKAGVTHDELRDSEPACPQAGATRTTRTTGLRTAWLRIIVIFHQQ